MKRITPGFIALILLASTCAVRAQTYVPVTIDFDDESKLQEVLDKPVRLQLHDEPLDRVLAELQKQVGIPIFVDSKGLTESGIADDTPVTVDMPSKPFADLLSQMLDQLDLTWMPRYRGIVITTPDVANQHLIARLYPVYDLVKAKDGGKVVLNFEPLIDLITSGVDADTWEENGGNGAIGPFNGSLVVSQTWQAHRKIERVLAAVREVQRQAPNDWENIVEKKKELKKERTAVQRKPKIPRTTPLFPTSAIGMRQ